MTKLFAIVSVAAILLIVSCTKDTVKQQSIITSKTTLRTTATGDATVSPESSMVYGAVTISGSGFGTNSANVTVSFDGVPGIVNSVADNKVVATVPANATNGKISITVGGNTVTTVNTLSILNLSKEFTYNNPAAIKFMDFDKTGKGYIYAGTATAIYKITSSGGKSLLFNVPKNDTSLKFQDGSFQFDYHYLLHGFVVAPDGNVYAFVQRDMYDYEPEANYSYDEVLGTAIYKITPDGHSTQVLGQFAKDNSDPTAAPGIVQYLLYSPTSSTIDNNGNIYVEDGFIYKIDPFGKRTTISSSYNFFSGGIVTDSHNNALVCNTNAFTVLGSITPPSKTINVVAGSGTGMLYNGPAGNVTLNRWNSMTIDNNDNVFIIGQAATSHAPGIVEKIVIINSAGYVSSFYPGFAVNYSQDQVFFDKASKKLYYLGNGGLTITRYAFR